SLIESKQKTDKWTFVLQVPKHCKESVCRTYGLPSGNVSEWEQNDYGTRVMGETTVSGLTTYFDARARGERSVKTFFVTADLSQVSEKEVKAMPDLSGNFRAYKVEKEEAVREFVEGKTGSSYIIGSGYYQLTKKEVVQASKRILVRKRGEKK